MLPDQVNPQQHGNMWAISALKYKPGQFIQLLFNYTETLDHATQIQLHAQLMLISPQPLVVWACSESWYAHTASVPVR